MSEPPTNAGAELSDDERGISEWSTEELLRELTASRAEVERLLERHAKDRVLFEQCLQSYRQSAADHHRNSLQLQIKVIELVKEVEKLTIVANEWAREQEAAGLANAFADLTDQKIMELHNKDMEIHAYIKPGARCAAR